MLLLLLPLTVLVLLNATIFLLWRARARAPASPGPVVESVEKLSAPSTSGAVRAVVRGRGFGSPDTNAVAVLFGVGTGAYARVLTHNATAVVCEVPPSPYPGIGYAVRVRVRVQVRSHSPGGFVAWRTSPLADATSDDNNGDGAWWTYAPSAAPTRAANVMLAWLYERDPWPMLAVTRLFAERLGPAWRIQLIAAPHVVAQYTRDPFVQEQRAAGRLEVVLRPRAGRREYARLQLDPAYWRSVHGDRVLVYQSGTVPCRDAVHDISEFFAYDYVGSPWCDSALRGGNSGLSLRNRTAVIRLLEKHADKIREKLSNPEWLFEDVFLSLSSFLLLCCCLCLILGMFLFDRQAWNVLWGTHGAQERGAAVQRGERVRWRHAVGRPQAVGVDPRGCVAHSSADVLRSVWCGRSSTRT